MAEPRMSDKEVRQIKRCMNYSPNDVDALCAELLDARTQAASDAAEIARLQNVLSFERRSKKAWRSRCHTYEARLAATGTVTEADLEKATHAARGWPSNAPLMCSIRAALEAFIAAKRAAPDQPADANAPGATPMPPLGDSRTDAMFVKCIANYAKSYEEEVLPLRKTSIQRLVSLVPATPAPPSDDQAGGAEGDAAFAVFTGWFESGEPEPASEMVREVIRVALASRPSSLNTDAVKWLVEALEEARKQLNYRRGHPSVKESLEFVDAALSHPAVTAALSGDPWLPIEKATKGGILHVVFDGPPGPEAGRFVEVEDAFGKSVSVGEWRQEGDYWHLVLPVALDLIEEVFDAADDAYIAECKRHDAGDDWRCRDRDAHRRGLRAAFQVALRPPAAPALRDKEPGL